MGAPERARWNRWAGLSLGAVVACVLAVGARMAWRDPGVAWLSSDGDAEWILFPVPATTSIRPLVETPAAFAAEITLPAPPRAPAMLRVRAFRRGHVSVNGQRVPLELFGPDWKQAREWDVAALLVPGRNTIEAEVWNGMGPPALWLELRSGNHLLAATGAGWRASIAGSSWRSAAPAREPPRGRRYDEVGASRRTLQALAAEWPTLAFLASLAAALAWAGRLALARRPHLRDSSRARWWALATVGLLWAALFANDLGDALPVTSGFDAREHLQYVQYVLSRHALPLADEGWQMFQPPLYYLSVALGLAATGMDTTSANAVLVVRGIGLLVGLAHVGMVGGFLRRLFPDRLLPRVAGGLVAAFLPCMLYLHQFPTNEILAAALSSWALVLALRIVQGPAPRWSEHVALGAALGAALLAKFSTLLVMLVVLAALALRAVERRGEIRQRLGKLAAVPLVAFGVCGWHFGRVWVRLGSPLVGGWEARPGMGWWLDPGYRTSEHFLRFGRVFADPLFAGLGGFWDGIFSTLWGDGLLSGLVRASVPTWWSPGLHGAGLGLAVVPTLAALAGLAVLGVRWLRSPTAELVLVFGPALAVLASLGLMTLRVPSVAQDKAFYGLLALAPLSALVGAGIEALCGRRTAPALVAVALLGTWAATSYATFWVRRGSPEALWRGAAVRMAGGDPDSALDLARRALAAAPGDWRVRLYLGRLLLRAGRIGPEADAVLASSEAGPDLAARHLALAELALRRGALDEGMARLERAISLAPDDDVAVQLRAEALEATGRQDAAERDWRDLVGLEPLNAAAQDALARLAEARGRPAEAALHRRLLDAVLEDRRARSRLPGSRPAAR